MNLFRLLKSEPRPVSLVALMRQHLLWMLLLRIVLYTLLLAINLALLDDRLDVIIMPPSLLILFILAIYLITIASAYLLLNLHDQYRVFGFCQTMLDALFASVLVYLTGASSSIFSAVYFFPIIAGGLLIPVKGGLIGAACSTLLFAGVLCLEYFGLLPDYLLHHSEMAAPSLMASANHFATKGLGFFLAAVISALFGSRLRSTTEALSSTRSDFDRLSLLYKQIFDNINTGIITVNGNGTITSANNATATISGLNISEMVGRSINALFPGINLTDTAARNTCDFERPDTKNIRIGYACSSISGNKGGSADSTIEAEQDLTIVTLQDIGETERLEGQVRQAEKLAAIGMMSAGIAHDFRNPLTAISGSAQVLAHEFAKKKDEQGHNFQLTEIIIRESDRLNKTIDNFLKFARPEDTRADWFLLERCLNEILQVCKANPKWPSTCTIEIEIEPNYRMWGDEKQVFTVISHLVNNALAFCPQGREHIVIKAWVDSNPGGHSTSSITVSDNGPGVAPKARKQIFEPFYTKRPNGTGLGLAIARQIVEAHHGFITVDAAPIGGAAFTVNIPYPMEIVTDERGRLSTPVL